MSDTEDFDNSNLEEIEDNSDEEDLEDNNEDAVETICDLNIDEKILTEDNLVENFKNIPKRLNILDALDLFLTEKQLLRPSFQDISPSYADGIPFLVDGDCLMITLMTDQNLSKQLGGSTLHLTYLFERFLNIFVQRGGNVHLVFFNCWRNIWSQNWNVLMNRSCLINHFSKNTPQCPVHVFENCFDPKFKDLLSEIRPGFIFTNMDAYEQCNYLENINKRLLKHIININLLMWLYYDLPCIDTNFIQVDLILVKGYYLMSDPYVRGLVTNLEAFFHNFFNNLPQIQECTNISNERIITKSNSIRRIIYLKAAQLFNEQSKDETMIKIFFLTEALMEYLQLPNRCCPQFEFELNELNLILEKWFKCLYFAISQLENSQNDWSTVSDLWQGLLFGHVCRFISKGVIENVDHLGFGLAEIYEEISNEFNIEPYPIQLSIIENWEDFLFPNVNERQEPTPLLPIKNPLVNAFCGEILNDLRWANPPDNLFIKREFREEHHFHTMRPITDECERVKDTLLARPPTDPKERKRYFRNIHRNSRFMNLYGASIEGRALTYSGVFRLVKDSKNKTKKKKNLSKKAQIIVDENIEKTYKELEIQEKEELDKLELILQNHNHNLNKVLNNIDIILSKIRPDSKNYLKGLILKLDTLQRIFKNYSSDEENIEIKKKIFLCIRKILTFDDNTKFSKKQKLLLSKCLHAINCNEIAKRNNLPVTSDSSESSDLNDTWIKFQLEQLGSELIRETGGTPDPRVKHFIPDPWQKKLFDIVDKKQSAVIVAPTSSGKTYASYYCMESVLREGTDGIVVYVAPTKALVNQVAATVYARFKDTKMPDGMSVYGVFTRDYKTNAMNSQILVTVPQCLEVLLLSPRRHNWVKHLRYVIFDEVHCIAGDIGALAFERCLLLIQCPFLALSATIQNPVLLQEWLQKAENFKQSRNQHDGYLTRNSYRVNLVVHSERHSDLTKFTYGNGELHHLHPYTNLEASVMESYGGIPSHMTLSPAETMQLYYAMCFSNPASNKLQQLSPEKYFSVKPENGFITRNSVTEYCHELSSLLEEWFTEDLESFKTTIEFLKPTADMDTITGSGRTYILQNIVNFILTLKEQNMLPAIVFCYDRNLIYQMTILLTKYFINSKKQIDRKDIKKEEKIEKNEKKMQQKEAAKNKIETPTRRYQRKLYLLSNSDDKSLQGKGTMTSDDMELIERRLMIAGINSSSILAESIRNGIMFHHSGLGAKIRSSVEMLFRKRILNVVFATGTLALGIHMPCKTAAVVGNSSFLNSLQYHQMSGRAGRRGYDNSGNVVFFGINPRKQHSLLTAKLPILKGNYPVNVTFILRSMLLVTDVTDKGIVTEEATNTAISRVLTLLENSLSFMHDPDLRLNIKHFFSFSLQLLKIQGFINDNGEPLRWCGLATHLHYHEPGNLAFVFLLRTGVIRELCTNIEDEKELHEILITILCHLFTYLPLDAASEQDFDNSIVTLDPLPDLIKQSLQNYNNQVNFVFNQFYLNIARHYMNDKDNILPISSVEINGKHITNNLREAADNIENKFLNLCVPNLVCSSFAALSGNSDENLYSPELLFSNIRQKMFTDVKVIPLIDLNTERNAYALDFYRHGIIEAIRKDNGLKSGQEFILITDFLLILKTIRVSLEEMMPLDQNDIVFNHFKKLENKYQELHSKAFGFAHY